jgi:N-methylhydantoinase B
MNASAPAPEIDPITLSVVQGTLGSIVDEMDLRLIRAAISPIVSEAKDMADGIFHPETGEMVAQGRAGLPVFLTQMQFTVQMCIEKARERGGLRPGDIWITNDVYAGGTHLNDVQLVTPFFYDGELEFVLASTAHWQDIGGSTPGGWTPNAVEIFAEGLQIPPLLLYREGELNEAVMDMIIANVRLKDDLRGDLVAMLAALREGDARLTQLLARRGAEVMRICVAELANRAEQMVRNEIRGIPDGSYSFTDYIDNDGVSDEPVKVMVRLNIEGDRLHFDLTGSSPATRGPMGLNWNTTVAACHIALKHVFPHIPVNGGALRPYTYEIPEDTCLNVSSPRPVSGYLEVLSRVTESVLGALGKAIPERVPAAAFGTSGLLTVAGEHPIDGHFFALTQPYPGGYGGGPEGDGLVHGPGHMSMARCLGIEMCERRFPIRYVYWQLRQDSGGAGRRSGGCGTEYAVETVAQGCEVTVLADRVEHVPWGALGGGVGAANRLWFTLEGEEWTPPLRSKASRIRMGIGDVVHLASPGGGGYGPPEQRERERVLRDVRLGYVSPARAVSDYGVTIDELKET